MKITKVIIMILVATMLSSCMTTRTSMNGYKEASGKTYKYSQGKQCYLFWGLIPIGRTSVSTPEGEPCQVRTSFRLFDAVCSYITGGIFSMQTIKVVAKHSASSQSSFTTGDIVTYEFMGKYAKGTIDSIIDNEKCIVKTEDGKLKKMKFENLSK